MMGILIFILTGCKSDEPANELTIDDLLYSSWNGQQAETMENGDVQTINFIILFTTAKEGGVTFLNSAGVPIQNFPIHYKREFGIRNAIKKLNRQLEKVAYSFGNFADI